jgi:phage FluMu protein Com
MTTADVLIRAVRLEIVKPLAPDTWETVGPLLRQLAAATPKLLNAAFEARVAAGVVGTEALRRRVLEYAPAVKAASADGLTYPAVMHAVEELREWAAKKEGRPFGDLSVPGDMGAKISRAACQAYGRRDQGNPRFSSKRILVGQAGVDLARDERGTVLELTLRPGRKHNSVRFAVMRGWGAQEKVVDALASKAWEYTDAKLQYDERRRKWYALVSYKQPRPEPVPVDPARVLAVHRGARNALYLLASTGERGMAFPGSKLLAQRRRLSARAREIKRTSQFERGLGSKGHGRSRRYEAYDALEDKIARVTHTFCQQAAAFVVAQADKLGCASVVIEDYGGIVEDDRATRRVLDHGPLYQLKQCVATALEKTGKRLDEVPSEYISSKCPRCKALDAGAHNVRTGIFHCKVCVFERPTDWVAAWWMLQSGGADMGPWEKRFERERKLAESLRSVTTKEEANGDQEKDDVRGAGRDGKGAATQERAGRGGFLRLPAARGGGRGRRVA